MLAFIALVACGSSRPAMTVDAPIDATPDTASDAASPRHEYVIDHATLPTSGGVAFGLDLDSDGMIDNQFRGIVGVVLGGGFDASMAAQDSIDTGATLMLVELDAADFQNTATATYTMYYGANPQPGGMFDIAADSPHDTPLAGSAAAGTFDCGPGQLGIEVQMFASDPPLQLHLIGARVRLMGVTATGITKGIVAGGVMPSEANAILTQLQANLPTIIERDCCGLSTSPGGATCDATGVPKCGCIDGSAGKTAIGLFDASPSDCAVSLAEIESNAIVHSVFTPDVTLGGVPAISFGMQITAVPAHF